MADEIIVVNQGERVRYSNAPAGYVFADGAIATEDGKPFQTNPGDEIAPTTVTAIVHKPDGTAHTYVGSDPELVQDAPIARPTIWYIDVTHDQPQRWYVGLFGEGIIVAESWREIWVRASPFD